MNVNEEIRSLKRKIEESSQLIAQIIGGLVTGMQDGFAVYQNMKFSASAIGKNPAKSPTLVKLGTGASLQFADAAEQEGVLNVLIPFDMDLSEDATIQVGWSSPTISQDCDWEIEYDITALNGDTDPANGTKIQSYEGSSSTADGLIVSEFCTITGGTIGSSDICLHITIRRDGADANDNLGDVANLLGMCFKYTANKLGKEI